MKSRFFRYRKPVFPDIFVGWAFFCPFGSFWELFLKRRKGQKSPCLFFGDPSHEQTKKNSTGGIRYKQEHPRRCKV
jgi:hypothetical protein